MAQNKKTKKSRVEWFILNMPFICFVALLGIVYISNAHYAERNMMKVQKLKKEMQELDWRYMDIQQQTKYGGIQSQLKKKMGDGELIENKSIPPKITITPS